jgi:hypothetical protein
MNALVAARVKKRRRDVREQNSRPVFSGLRHGGAEKKFNRTGGTAGKTLAGGLAQRKTATRIRYRRIESCAASTGAKPPSRRLGFWAKPIFIHDLFYPFYRRLEFCMLLNSGYLA